MDLRGSYYNTKHQVRALEALLEKLPDPTAPVRPLTQHPGLKGARLLDEQQVQALIEEYRAGATVAELGKQFSISRQTVTRMLHQHDVYIRARGLSAAQVDEVVRLYGEGLSLARVGERLGINGTTVLKRLRERGVETRDAQTRSR